MHLRYLTHTHTCVHKHNTVCVLKSVLWYLILFCVIHSYIKWKIFHFKLKSFTLFSSGISKALLLVFFIFIHHPFSYITNVWISMWTLIHLMKANIVYFDDFIQGRGGNRLNWGVSVISAGAVEWSSQWPWQLQSSNCRASITASFLFHLSTFSFFFLLFLSNMDSLFMNFLSSSSWTSLCSRSSSVFFYIQGWQHHPWTHPWSLPLFLCFPPCSHAGDKSTCFSLCHQPQKPPGSGWATLCRQPGRTELVAIQLSTEWQFHLP